MASSPASKAPSWIIGLKPWFATFGPQKSNSTRSERTSPAFRARTTG